ncbi:MAG: hypothetical protein A3I07_02055 [Candidatus Doudnabacteria bacterium RIFCSPLOWO2_02_FULL_42_9]|uniref:Uncharacterized protein n=1 Tax=Candidatus Doudnabacteria bacterium RIFCSPHIGHO2_01_FULL_41_86 TaxID=1817821 RepID=A0A1F5N7P6_9BACT|nr:MAG: hypothetical protein A2717_03705 [Candidatus Doudnabacteria bacterium RIFCSPHIGHO2_01_FULL_41_86]OGE74779.1 MAG: hypothetical protein A3K07_03295 [Candidatus Doudnabacteria bacterium RIFCSPHIGHO2_01_43_10]OGE85747.1 MAG: hypothetical protein A3E28_03035 [Candidatus Doudnabacteria bacterium RIFCSPHIGHO2_12_FULL_42_22]OGE87242.1 MAG: hypothetical protein A3C49_00660 [Candidatus Doudnabacteria bacterium RIFCSPHIGHO2_02_FULL_42_25]OGE92079.1 MAG: hypothetical protein A2895_00535 [Candidatus
MADLTWQQWLKIIVVGGSLACAGLWFFELRHNPYRKLSFAERILHNWAQNGVRRNARKHAEQQAKAAASDIVQT